MALDFTGFSLGLGNIALLSNAKTRSISAENVYGEKGRGGMAKLGEPQEEVTRIGQRWDPFDAGKEELGQGWKVRPCVTIPANGTTTIMDVDGPGVIQHIWMTVEKMSLRDLIVRIYWDGEETPSVEVPLGDFFCCGWNTPTNVVSLPINVNPTGAMHSYWPMPFRTHARVTIENRAPEDRWLFFYTIDYALTEIPEQAAYFHAQFRRVNPVPYKDVYTILDGVRGNGQYVGTYMAWQQNNEGWWGEGEFKAYIDGDSDFPTICGTGTEDYFGGSWGFAENYSAPFLGKPFGPSDNKVGSRHGMYRWHIMDPIRFEQDLRITIQALAWRSGGRYLPLQDDISSVAYWYQSEPHGAFPALPDRNYLEVI